MLQSRSPRCADGARAVADDLHLDVAGARQQLLDVDVAVAEGGLAPPSGSAPMRVVELVGAVTARMPRPPPPATALTITAPLGPSEAMNARASSSVVGPGGARRAPARRSARRARAPAPCRRTAQRLGPRADERDAGALRSAGERGVLAEEAIARMDGVAARLARGGDERSASR